MSESNKPGYMGRAVIAWLIYNVLTFLTLSVVLYLLGEQRNNWMVLVILLVAFVVTQWVIMLETIGPFIKDWIRLGNTTGGGNV